MVEEYAPEFLSNFWESKVNLIERQDGWWQHIKIKYFFWTFPFSASIRCKPCRCRLWSWHLWIQPFPMQRSVLTWHWPSLCRLLLENFSFESHFSPHKVSWYRSCTPGQRLPQCLSLWNRSFLISSWQPLRHLLLLLGPPSPHPIRSKNQL